MPRYPVARRQRDSAPDLTGGGAALAHHNREIDGRTDPYRAQHGIGYTRTHASVPAHSFFRDVWVVAQSEARAERSLGRAIEHGGRAGSGEGDQEPPSFGWADDTP